MRCIGLLVGMTGCAQLFGLDTTTGSGPDAPGPGSHASFRLASIASTTTLAPYDLAPTESVTFLVPNPNDPTGYDKIPGQLEGPGSWHAAIEAVNPVVDFTIRGTRHVWAFPTHDLKYEVRDLAHPNAGPASPTASLNISIAIPAYAPPEAFELQAIGAWSHDALPAPAAGAVSIDAPTLAYTDFSPMATLPIARIIPTDTFVLLRHNVGDLTGVFQTAFDQAETNTVTGTLAAVTMDRTLDANITPPALATRYTAVRPAVTGLGMSWSLNAAPGYQRGINYGPQLAAGSSTMADAKITHAYGNPFISVGWNELLVFATSEQRTVMVNGGMLGLSAGLYTYIEPTPNMTLDLPAGLPESISMDQVPLTTDNMAVTIDAQKGAHVTFIADRVTNVMYQAVLDEVMVNGASATLQTVVETTSTDPANLWLPSDAFVDGHIYTIELVCFQGEFPNAATGDLQTTQLPNHVGYNFSGVFTATKP